MGLQRVGHDLEPPSPRKYKHTHTHTHTHNLNYFAVHQKLTQQSINYTERLKAGGEGDDRG